MLGKTPSDAAPDKTADSPDRGRLDYKVAGVDIAAGNALVERIKPLCAKTLRPEVIGGVGGFAGLFQFTHSKYRSPVLVSATDGVGTKLTLARELDAHDSIGIDLVAMCVNDILTHGAEPLFFLDYFACGRLSVDTAATVIAGIAEGCELAGCALIGGETAEMPGVYATGEYDLAGFAVGVAERDTLCGAHRVKNGDAVIALASNGVHANGFSLVRKVIAQSNADLAQPVGDDTLGDALIAPTHIYVKALLPVIAQGGIHALAHITGGGLSENLPRVIGAGQAATVDLQSWTRPPVFEWLRDTGNIEEQEMLRVFNCGVGMAVIAAQAQASALIRQLKKAGFNAWQLGEITARGKQAPVVYI